MIDYRTLLVPYDFSEHAAAVLESSSNPTASDSAI